SVWGRSSRSPGSEGRADCKLRRIRTDDQNHSKGRSNIEGNRRGSIDGENVRGSDRGGERPASGVSVDSRAARTSSVITKVPGASRSAQTACSGRCRADRNANLGWIRSSDRGYGQPRVDSYRDVG